MIRFSFCLLAAIVTCNGHAATFTANGGAGSSTIPGDYPSLSAAAADFSNSITPVTGDYTFFITGSLVEPNNVAFGKATGTNTVRIKPAPSTSPVITFTSTTVPSSTTGFAGHLVIGTTSTLNSIDQLTTTSNFIIDGSNTVGGVTRDLTIKNDAGTSSSSNQFLIMIAGACDNVQVRNATLIADRQTTLLLEQIILEMASRRVAGVNYHPSNVTVDNCDFRTPNALNGQAIVSRNVGTVNSGSVQTNLRVTSNTISTSHRCVFLGINGNTVIENNTLSVKVNPGWSRTPDMINHSSTGSNGVNNWNIRVNNNRFAKFENLSTGTLDTTNGGGLSAMLLLGGGTTSGTYEIFNNTFGGFDYNSPAIPSGNYGVYRCICQQSGNSPSTINITHNSFNMPNFPNITGQGHYFRYNAVSVPVANVNATVNVFNNIFRFEQSNGVVFHRGTGGTGNFFSDYNVFHLGSTGRMAVYPGSTTIAAPTHSTLAQWQATGRDLNSKEADPVQGVTPSSGKWISDSNLHFDASPGNLFAGTPTAIAYDMDYEPRSLTMPYIGADEGSTPLQTPTAAENWSLFQ